jgi:hypothetical protein
MRMHRPGGGCEAVRAGFMAVRVNLRGLATMFVGVHRAVGVTVLVRVRLAFEPDFA